VGVDPIHEPGVFSFGLNPERALQVI
jgi:hypothetical protein